MSLTFWRSSRSSWAAPFIVLVSFALRLWNLGEASLWIDEKLVDMWRHQPLQDAYSSLISFGTEMPLYAALLRIVPVANELTLRLPSALLGMLGTALVIAVAGQTLRNRPLALWSGALIATNPLHVWLSRTARAYALVFVITLLATVFFLRLLRAPRSRSAWWGFVVSSAAAYLTHVFCLFLPFAQLITLLIAGNQIDRRRWLSAQALAGLPVGFWSAQIVILNVLSDGRFLAFHGKWLPTPSLRDLPVTFANLATGYDGHAAVWPWIPALLAAGLGLWSAVRILTGPPNNRHTVFHLVLLASLPVAVAFAVAHVRPVYLDRYFVVSLPALAIVMAAGWQRLRSRLLQSVLPALVVLTGFATVVVSLSTSGGEKIAWRQAGAFLSEAIQPGDGLLLDRNVTLDPLLHYFSQTTNDLVVWEWSEDEGKFPIPDSFSSHPARLWIVYPNPHTDLHRQGALPDFDPFEPGLTRLGDWLAQQPGVTEQASFTGVSILLRTLNAVVSLNTVGRIMIKTSAGEYHERVGNNRQLLPE